MTIFVSTKHNFAATTNPGTGDDSGDGYSVGSHWYNVTLDLAWYCIDATLTAAIWQLVDPVRTLGQSAVQIPHTGTTNATVLATVNVAANWPGANGQLDIYSQWSWNNDASNKNAQIRVGGAAGTILLGFTGSTSQSITDRRWIGFRNSLASQVAFGVNSLGSGPINVAPATFTLDFSSAQTIDFVGVLADGTDTMNLEQYRVEARYKP